MAEATRVRNRLHADLVVLVPGYGAKAANLVALRNRQAAGRRSDRCAASRPSSRVIGWLVSGD